MPTLQIALSSQHQTLNPFLNTDNSYGGSPEKMNLGSWSRVERLQFENAGNPHSWIVDSLEGYRTAPKLKPR